NIILQESRELLKTNSEFVEKTARVETIESLKTKEKILKYSKAFGGLLNDKELMEFIEILMNKYYKYKKELVNEKFLAPSLKNITAIKCPRYIPNRNY
ncbi:MAG: hypothetical protein ACRC6E_06705, partial [Fusobacteriaceae bacterium]